MAQPAPQLAPPQSIVQPTPQLAARAGAPRRAHRLEPAQSCGVRLLKRGLEHIFGRQQGYATLHPRRAFRGLGERCRLLRLAHVVFRAEVRAQLLDALASEEANVQLTGRSTEGAGGVEAAGACHHSDELLGRAVGAVARSVVHPVAERARAACGRPRTGDYLALVLAIFLATAHPNSRLLLLRPSRCVHTVDFASVWGGNRPPYVK
eukprot:scaffold37429_cov60-Phaeocystis_antarctica.AAC.9